ncbi:DUF4214 domain-containing protein [Noviherbaspirillum aerium]|uniref:DUF4214 domain-containing protein n=1 Tax=Noviherbaspirillum aerium TaxID=2588497 RepID=UPI00124D8E98|nr:DUF4214 domain-containing protein [Noviherbaspirillum aerium]
MANVVGTPQSTVISNSISGDYRIDVLLGGDAYRWNSSSAAGTPVEVTYSFMTAAPVYTSFSNKTGFMAFTAEQKTVVKQIFSDIQAQFNITFREVGDTAYSYGQIRLGNNSQGTSSAAYAYMPDPYAGQDSGDVYVNRDDSSNLARITPGSYAYATLVHEIGHALGLKHPGNYNAGYAPSTEPGNYLAAAEDSEALTVMSYSSVTQGQNRSFYGTYDILALQYMYGARPYNTGDNTYSFTNATGQRLEIINDSGGTDTIDVSAVTAGAKINLLEGALSSVGKLANGFTPAQNNVSIAYGVKIEKVIGSAYADQIIGNDGNNDFTPGMGNDLIEGGGGIDTVFVSTLRFRATVSRSGDTVVVADKSGSEGSDTLFNVERIQFADMNVALDGTAAASYRLYQAAFDRKPDVQGLGYWIAQADRGLSLQDAAWNFIASAEFQQKYGEGLSDSGFITALYANVLHRAPDTAGFNYWSSMLAQGLISRHGMLAEFSEGYENQKQVEGAITNGIDYLFFA